MKLNQIIIKNNDIVASTKEAIISTMIAYGKTHKLLHKQLWDKDQLKATGDRSKFTILDASGNDLSETYNLNDVPQRVVMVDYEFTLNDRPVKPIKHWNIKSPSIQAYKEDDLLALGLNQMFVGQSPYTKYEGDPKDGIYHDDCLIQPKASEETTQSEDRYGWYIIGHGHWLEYDEFGNPLTLSVTIDDVAHTYTVTTPSGSETFDLSQVELDDGGTEGGTYTGYPEVQYLNFSVGNDSGLVYDKYTLFPDFSEHGEILYETTDIAYVRPQGSFELAYALNPPNAITRVYADGTCIQLTQETTIVKSIDGADLYESIPASIRYLPLVYTDTGDLVQNRVDYIETWDEMFELYVHEDSYWYTGLIGIAVIVVSMVIAYLTGIWISGVEFGTMSSTLAISTLSAGVGAMGAISGNKVFQVLGILGSLYSTISNVGANAISSAELGVSSFGRSASEVLESAGFGELFDGFISTVGFSNLEQLSNTLYLGNTAFNIYSTVTMPSMSASVEDVVEEDGMTAWFEEEDNGSYLSNVNRIIEKQIRI